MRVVSLVPSITEAVCILGKAHTLVGVTDYCLHPADVVARTERIGGTKNPDLATIRRLHPDLVIANTDEQRAETLTELEGEAYDLLVTETDSLDDVAETWTQLGVALDAEAAATRERATLDDALHAAREQSRQAARLATLIPVWKKPWMAAGGGTYLGDLLATCGFDNLLEPIPTKWVRFEPTLDAAEADHHQAKTGPHKDQPVHALPAVPDVVLLPTEPYAFADDDRDDFTALGVPRAHVRVVDGELLTWWLSKSADALVHFTRLHRELAAQTEKKPANASAGSSTSTGRKSSGNARR